jgi:hypothetical protein
MAVGSDLHLQKVAVRAPGREPCPIPEREAAMVFLAAVCSNCLAD